MANPPPQGSDKNGKLHLEVHLPRRSSNHLPVTGGPLTLCSPNEGFHKDGYCRSSARSDPRNFSVAATLTHSFLQSEYGNDPPYNGHRAGQKMCISALHFQQAIKEMGPDLGPKVHLEATGERALETVKLEELREYSHKPGPGRGGEL